MSILIVLQILNLSVISSAWVALCLLVFVVAYSYGGRQFVKTIVAAEESTRKSRQGSAPSTASGSTAGSVSGDRTSDSDPASTNAAAKTKPIHIRITYTSRRVAFWAGMALLFSVAFGMTKFVLQTVFLPLIPICAIIMTMNCSWFIKESNESQRRKSAAVGPA